MGQSSLIPVAIAARQHQLIDRALARLAPRLQFEPIREHRPQHDVDRVSRHDCAIGRLRLDVIRLALQPVGSAGELEGEDPIRPPDDLLHGQVADRHSAARLDGHHRPRATAGTALDGHDFETRFLRSGSLRIEIGTSGQTDECRKGDTRPGHPVSAGVRVVCVHSQFSP